MGSNNKLLLFGNGCVREIVASPLPDTNKLLETLKSLRSSKYDLSLINQVHPS